MGERSADRSEARTSRAEGGSQGPHLEGAGLVRYFRGDRCSGAEAEKVWLGLNLSSSVTPNLSLLCFIDCSHLGTGHFTGSRCVAHACHALTLLRQRVNGGGRGRSEGATRCAGAVFGLIRSTIRDSLHINQRGRPS